MHFKKRVFVRSFGSFIALLLILTASASSASAERRERLIDTWRPLHYDVRLVFDDRLSTIKAARTEILVEILKESVSTIDFDFGNLEIDALHVEDTLATYQQRAGTLLVQLPKPAKRNDRLRIAVVYHGKPTDGLILTVDKDGKPSVTGDNWPDRVHHWIPSLDHPAAKATVRFIVVAPGRNVVVANGRLESTDTNNDTTRTWVWNEAVPISPYCMIICVAEFAQVEADGPTVTPLTFYVPKSEGGIARQGFSPADPSLKLFSELVAPYPYEKLAMIVGATRYGGMENSSAIVFGSSLFNDFEKSTRSRTYNIPEGVRNVVAHEIAHQWFGDSVTESTWSDLWLSEGFATYFCALFIERIEGQSDFRAYMKNAAEEYFTYEKKRKAPIHDRETENLNQLLNANNYEKGAWVLHMLRGLMGDKAFFDGIRSYYDAHRNSTASTEDLRAALERSSRLDLKDFFTRWVYQSGHPRYVVTWKWRPASKKRGANSKAMLVVTVKQVQFGAPFLIPIPIDVVTNGVKNRSTVTPTGKVTVASIPAAKRPASLVFDPDDVVLDEATVRRAP